MFFRYVRNDNKFLEFEQKRKLSFFSNPTSRALRRTVELDSTGNFVIIKEYVANAEIRNSLKTGSDLERSLKSTLNEMTKDHVIAIKEYGKKLSPLSMFYMIVGTILPALGSALMVVGLGFVNINITFTVFGFLLFGLASIQIFFIMFFRALKPPVMN